MRKTCYLSTHPCYLLAGTSKNLAIALAETINGLYKAEVIHRRSWRNLQDVELATLDWVDWFKHKRLLGPIGNIPPA